MLLNTGRSHLHAKPASSADVEHLLEKLVEKRRRSDKHVGAIEDHVLPGEVRRESVRKLARLFASAGMLGCAEAKGHPLARIERQTERDDHAGQIGHDVMVLAFGLQRQLGGAAASHHPTFDCDDLLPRRGQALSASAIVDGARQVLKRQLDRGAVGGRSVYAGFEE
jgi:hypothetical protein